jgi:hypothetical protein
MTTPPIRTEPWDDDRLDSAFAARASRTATPLDLARATSAALRARPVATPFWRRLMAPAAAAVLAAVAIAGGVVLIGGERGASPLVDFRAGPTADQRTLDAREFAFEFPAEWQAYDSSASGSGFSSIAVLGTLPVEPSCGDERHVVITCVNERRLAPAEARMVVSTGTLLSGPLATRPDIDNGETTRLSIDGRTAILDDVEADGDDYYGANLSLHLYIERPGDTSSIVLIDLFARDPGAADARAVMQTVIETFRFDLAAVPAPSDFWAGRSAVGLPIISVSEAIAISDAGIDDREIAVHGWFHPIPLVGCPAPPPPTSPVQPVCPDQFRWLTEQMESLTTVSATGASASPPTGPAVHPDLDLIDHGWAPGIPASGAATPVEVVLVGHFDDRRSSLCPAAEEDACRERFVVDRVDWVNGETQPMSVVAEVEEQRSSTADEIAALAQRHAPRGTILSVFVTDGATGLVRAEPVVAASAPDLMAAAAVWGIRVLEGGRVSTYLIPDGSDDIYQVDVERVIPIAPALRSQAPRRRSGRRPSSTGHDPEARVRGGACSCPSTRAHRP